ncbi:Putative uncharacterized protein [Moritella viscosa]|uniref:Uncharacterized protein n=1 Tax=Moritella viscosa TaxID=80854 RepID=A0A1L0C4J3_9GAMM|nr:Putative uncharacterized protein [Moritella viscosa]SGZ15370.1 Putative uncharacterized protein [Moritella viscosa]SGZ16406.1 Putative uncharacterized protein [Moritella viscosa]SHO14877.1 Putative uncharacterized protein [Moritella viscosa]SHO15007.1 Putative uncharacterized protein [Moritella viscosa]
MTKVNSCLRFFTIKQPFDLKQTRMSKPLIGMLFMWDYKYKHL